MPQAESTLAEPQPSRARGSRKHVAVLFVVIFLAYNLNLSRVGGIDCKPAPLMAVSFIRHGDFNLDEFPALRTRWAVKRGEGGHWVSRWTPGSALFCIPFFLVPTLLGLQAPGPGVDVLAKLTASTVTALSAVFLYLCLLQFCSARGATWLTIAYALGSAHFSMSSQDIWQHGPAALCLSAGLYGLLIGRHNRGWQAAAGFCLSMAVVCRPTMAVFAAAALVWGLRRDGWRAGLWYALGAIAPVAFLAEYNLQYFGTLGLAGYADMPGSGWVPGQMPVALAGLLVSPNRGMFVFSPFLLMLIYGAVRGVRHERPSRRELAIVMLAAIAAHLLLNSAWESWHAIVSFGCRYSADAMPFWIILGAFGIDRILARVSGRWVFGMLVALSIAIQSLGVFVEINRWNWLQINRLVSETGRTDDFSSVPWSLDPPQIVWQFRCGVGLEDPDTVSPPKDRLNEGTLPAERGPQSLRRVRPIRRSPSGRIPERPGRSGMNRSGTLTRGEVSEAGPSRSRPPASREPPPDRRPGARPPRPARRSGAVGSRFGSSSACHIPASRLYDLARL